MTAAAPLPSSLLLVGCGKMGAALLAGWRAQQAARRYFVVDPAPAADLGAFADVAWHKLPAELPAELGPAAVVLAVKPQSLTAILPAYARFAAGPAVFLSIIAGKTLGGFERQLGSEAAVVRAMPNTPAAIGRGIAVACANSRVGAEGLALCGRLLAAVGEVAWVKEEALLDPVTAVSGSGPAYVFLLIECLAKAGIAAGLAPELAARLARATVAGAGELAARSSATAAELREAVTSPGGTTRAALDILMGSDGLEPLLTRAVAAATRRSRELAE